MINTIRAALSRAYAALTRARPGKPGSKKFKWGSLSRGRATRRHEDEEPRGRQPDVKPTTASEGPGRVPTASSGQGHLGTGGQFPAACFNPCNPILESDENGQCGWDANCDMTSPAYTGCDVTSPPRVSGAMTSPPDISGIVASTAAVNAVVASTAAASCGTTCP